MQKEIQKTMGKNVESLYLTYMNPGQLNSSVNYGQRRPNFKPPCKTCVKMLLAPSSTAFPLRQLVRGPKLRDFGGR